MTQPLQKRPIGSIFVEKGFVTQEQLDDALLEQRESGQRLGEILVERGYVSRIDLASVIGSQLGELRLLRGGLEESKPAPEPAVQTGPDTSELEQRLANQAESIDQLLDRINELEGVLAESTGTSSEQRVQELEAELAARTARVGELEERLRAAETAGGADAATQVPSAQFVYAETTEGYRLLSWAGPAPAREDPDVTGPEGARPSSTERLVLVDRVEPDGV
jgi:hypothetical protein